MGSKGVIKLDKPRRNKITNRKIGTTITFTPDDLSTLARYISAGMVFLQTNHPVVSKIKAALTRLGLPKPKGF